MLDPTEIYEIDDEQAGDVGRTLVYQLQGYIDAGHAGRLAVHQLLDGLPSTVLATFDVDQLIDYRSRRPTMTFHRDRWTDYAEPVLVLHRVTDLDGTPFLLLTGPEPDTQWERFTAAVVGLVERYGIELTVGLHAIPMAVPHTRPAGVTAHATRAALISEYEPWSNTVELPGSVGALLELRLGQAGRDAMGLAAHVPHYLAETEYPQAATALLEHLVTNTGLSLPADALLRAAETVGAEVERKVAESEQALKVVRALERRYDSEVGAQPQPPLLAEGGELPDADELGAEIERFLAEQES